MIVSATISRKGSALGTILLYQVVITGVEGNIIRLSLGILNLYGIIPTKL